MEGTETAELRQCVTCRWWGRWLTGKGQCAHCAFGWVHCTEHGRLEWEDGGVPEEDGGHRRVSVRDVGQAPPLRTVA
jgi:hypothetical protein